MCSVQKRALTDVDYVEHVKAGEDIARCADDRVLKYLPSSDLSKLSKRLVYFHLPLDSIVFVLTAAVLAT